MIWWLNVKNPSRQNTSSKLKNRVYPNALEKNRLETFFWEPGQFSGNSQQLAVANHPIRCGQEFRTANCQLLQEKGTRERELQEKNGEFVRLEVNKKSETMQKTQIEQDVWKVHSCFSFLIFDILNSNITRAFISSDDQKDVVPNEKHPAPGEDGRADAIPTRTGREVNGRPALRH